MRRQPSPSSIGQRDQREGPLDALARHQAWGLALARQLDDETLRRQYHPELSPIGWHIGHCALVERYWIDESILGSPADPDDHALYFPENNAKEERAGRLPSGDTLVGWAAAIHRLTLERLAEPPPRLAEHPLMARDYLAHFLEQHYAQHRETLCYCLAAMRTGDPDTAALGLSRAVLPQPVPPDSVRLPAGSYRVGTDDVRGYDNEGPAQTVRLDGVDLARRPVTNAQWLAFMDADGYDPAARWWSAEGAAWLRETATRNPATWRIDSAGRYAWYGAYGPEPLAADAPVSGINHHEARAFAAWAGARLPHEHEWEAATQRGQLVDVGDVWEWCANTLEPYPGFQAFPYEGYSVPWFDGNHYVLRGGSRFTDRRLLRPSFRNFFEPHIRHQFGGLRLAWDATDSHA